MATGTWEAGLVGLFRSPASTPLVAGEVAPSGIVSRSIGAGFGAVKPWRLHSQHHPLPLHTSCCATTKIVQVRRFSCKSRKRRKRFQASTDEVGETETSDGVQGTEPGEDVDDNRSAEDEGTVPTVQVEIAPSVLQLLGSTSSPSSSSSSFIEQNQRKRREQKEAAAVVSQRPPSKLEAHLSALNALLGPKEGTLSSPSSLPAAAVPSSAGENVRDEKSEGEPKGDEVTDERMRYVRSLLNQPPTPTGPLLELDIGTAEWWYPGAVLLWTTLLGSVARVKELEDGNEGTNGETMDKEAGFVVRAMMGDLDPKEALDANFRQVQTDSDMVSEIFVGADGRGINEDRDAKKEWLFLANMYTQLEKKPSLLSVWDERDWLLKNVFLDSSFTVVGEALRCQHGLLFFGTISGASVDQTRAELQERLKKNYFFSLMPILLKEVKTDDEVQCLICSPQSILSLRVPKAYEDAVFIALSIGVAIGSYQALLAADPGMDTLSQWQQAVVPLGLLAVLNVGHLVRGAVASAYNVSHQLMKPWFLPFPHVGVFASFTPYVGCLPNRKCLLDLSIYSNMASLMLSSLLILTSFSPWFSPHWVTDAVVDLGGFVAAPAGLLAHSGPLTWLMRHLSVAASSTEDGGILYIISPWALAGILGLHITAMGLLPVGALDGGRILTGLVGRGDRFLRLLVFATVAANVAASQSYLPTGAWLLFMLLVSGDDWYQLDEVTEPDLLTKTISSMLVLGGVACFLVPLEWIS